jgi:hypothetical protein
MGIKLAYAGCMGKSKMTPEFRFTILMFIVAVLIILSIMNKWI